MAAHLRQDYIAPADDKLFEVCVVQPDEQVYVVGRRSIGSEARILYDNMKHSWGGVERQSCGRYLLMRPVLKKHAAPLSGDYGLPLSYDVEKPETWPTEVS